MFSLYNEDLINMKDSHLNLSLQFWINSFILISIFPIKLWFPKKLQSHISKTIGEGAYSSVYKVKRLLDNQEYALKKVKLINLSEKEKENALNEVRILASIHHVNIIGYKEAFFDEQSNSLCIIMEYANNGDLYQKILEHQKKNTQFSEKEIWQIFTQVVKGLNTLHKLKIFHRDLKSANVFLTKEGVVKLGDMNVSKVAKKGLLFTQTGTPYYASPEVWKDKSYDTKSDIWSLGCVFYEITTLKPPFRAEDMEGLYKKVIKGHYPKISSNYSLDLAHIIRSLLQVQSNLRPSCDEILQNQIVMKHMDQNQIAPEYEEGPNNLLNTIRIPKNIQKLIERLPKSNYCAHSSEQSLQKNLILPKLNLRNEKNDENNSLSNAAINEKAINNINNLLKKKYRYGSIQSQQNNKDESQLYPNIVLQKQSQPQLLDDLYKLPNILSSKLQKVQALSSKNQENIKQIEKLYNYNPPKDKYGNIRSSKNKSVLYNNKSLINNIKNLDSNLYR
ncbi:protein kinase domain protein [Ichthyophthirius multifiliis]|uniref:non-specific serine/threonine protein kinase n=1 Tax=Ichthyophthirius multifiliis TaxID=5932 RepID=G0QRD1_ICHMU|nr:protein kinase domain protein [Ichthyophthirius multifiliis]EGR32229.1 protein kinase domain protein [Ichthyophthirius multifiliis]|eukprot:XP_004035715.1 protein kinase domain protein [Ichthyophthirius multifiliis]